jgi:hypothetical protein
MERMINSELGCFATLAWWKQDGATFFIALLAHDGHVPSRMMRL